MLLQKTLHMSQPVAECNARLASIQLYRRQFLMALTMTQNGALYAVQHGATSDAFEITARSKSLPNTRA